MPSISRRLYTSLLATLLALTSLASPYCDIRKFSILDGLAANIITDLMQGSDNLMWFGTQNGLSFYDGRVFHTFRDASSNNDELSTNRISFIRPCNNNDVWCVTYDRQLYVYDTRLCHFVPVGRDISKKLGTDLRVKEIYPIKGAGTWIVTNKDYLLCMRSKEISDENPEVVRVGQHGLRSGNALYITTDEKGRLWMLTDRGTTIYNHPFSTPIPFKWIRQVGHDVFLATADGRLAIFDKRERLSQIKLPAGVTRINELKSTSHLLLMGTNLGIVTYDPNTFKTDVINVQSPSQPETEVTKMYVDSQGKIWAFTQGMGITRIDPQTDHKEWLFADAKDPLQRTTCEQPFIMEDEHNTMWMIPNQGTFSYYDAARHQLVAYPLITDATGDNTVRTISRYAVSDQGILWFTGHHDLIQVNFKYHDFSLTGLGQGESEVRAMALLPDGRHIDGYRNGVIQISDASNHILGYLSPTGQITPQQTAFSRRGIYALYEDSQKRLWIGTDGDGLYMVENGHLSHFVYEPKAHSSIPSDTIYDITSDRNGNIWIATYGGGLSVVREHPSQTISFISKHNGMSWPKDYYDKVRRITCMPGGDILVGTCGGLVTFKDQIKNYAHIPFYTTRNIEGDPQSLDASDVNFPFLHSNGDIYISQLGGRLQRVADKACTANNLKMEIVKNIDPDEGVAFGMVEDNNGNIWIVRESSIDKYNPKTGTTDIFGPNDFDYNMSFTEARPIHDPTTDLISVGTMLGRITFNPQQLTKTTYQPKVIFTTMQFNGDTDATPILHKEKITIPSNKRNLIINFASLDYTRDYQTKYEYRIDNFTPEGQWIPIGKRRSIGFNRISHGHYILKVRATNTHGYWSKHVAELKLDVKPTFWESIWGRLIIILFALGAIVLLFYVHNWQQKQHMTHELSVLKNNFFSDASHKLRTPLTLIQGPVNEILTNDNTLSNDSRDLLQVVKRNALEMLNMLNRMLAYDNSKDFYEDGGETTTITQHDTEGGVDDNNAHALIKGLSQADPAPDSNKATTADAAEGTEETEGEEAEKESTILIVEDNKDLQIFLETILKKVHRVVLADNGMAGLQMARKHVPDFILTDVTMPVMDGITMVHLIKQDTNLAHIPIIVLSAKASLADHMKAFKEGVDGYLTKPFSAEYLIERIQSVITQRRMLQQEMLRRIQQSDDTLLKKYIETQTASAKARQQAASSNTDASQEKTNSLISIPLGDKVMEKIVKFVTDNIADPELKIDDIARATGMSRSVLYGKIKNTVGLTPVDFVRHIRIMRATEMLQQTDDTLTVIAYSVGFSDPKYFSKVFKKEMGIIPSDYRERTKQ